MNHGDALVVVTTQEIANSLADPAAHVGDVIDIPNGAFVFFKRAAASPDDCRQIIKGWYAAFEQVGRTDIKLCMVNDIDDVLPVDIPKGGFLFLRRGGMSMEGCVKYQKTWAESMSRIGRADITIGILGNDEEIIIPDAARMRDLGWSRIE